MCAALSRCAWAGVLPFGWRVCAGLSGRAWAAGVRRCGIESKSGCGSELIAAGAEVSELVGAGSAHVGLCLQRTIGDLVLISF